jgi:RNA 3'-terminal phosphate cyclase (ATP)
MRIDGGQGEGGGQILRVALSLSAVRGVPITVHSVRAGRRPAGLKAQHVTAVEALAAICQAEVAGARAGSTEVSFVPGPIRSGDYRFEVGTAGATTLVLQAILLPLALADGPSRVALTGGTHVPWSPPAHFLSAVLLPALEMAGVEARASLARWGMFPRGGGEIVVEVKGGAQLRPISLLRTTGAIRIRGLSAVSRLPVAIAERQRDRARGRLEGQGLSVEIDLVEADAGDPGSFLFLSADSGGVPAGFSALGERGKPAERVADEAVEGVLAYLQSGAACDPFLADQLAAVMAAAPGTSRLTASCLSRHLLSSLRVCQQLLGCSYQASGPEGTPGSVTVEGVGLRPSGREPRPADPGGVPGRRPLAPDPVASPVVRKARAGDVPAMQELVAHFAAKGELLPRTLGEFYQHLRDFFICELNGRLVGICALSLYWEDLAEVRSLAVREEAGGQGLGSRLVEACVAEAAALGIRRTFALTYRPGFFARHGFQVIDKRELPQKIWKDCFKCAKFANCDETALIRDTASG